MVLFLNYRRIKEGTSGVKGGEKGGEERGKNGYFDGELVKDIVKNRKWKGYI